MDKPPKMTTPPKRNAKGKWISSHQKEMIVNAYKNKVEVDPNITIRKVRKILSNELGIGETTISNTIKEYRETKTVSSPNKTRKCKNITTKIDDFDKEAIRRKIHQFLINRELPTLDKIHVAINKDETLPNFSRSSLFRLLESLQFKYVKRGRKSALIDSNDIILWRRKYLRNINKYRAEGRPIYYLDEMWMNAGDVTGNTCATFSKGLSTRSVKNPSSKGKHLIFVHIISDDGFVNGGLLCFESKKNIQDFHGEMDKDSFRDWFVKVLPRLKENAVIVLDNAPCHSAKVEICPTTNWKKADIIGWLEMKGEVIDPSMIIPELMDIVKRLEPLYNRFAIDELALKQNKTVLRLPPYHSGLNPMEMVWLVVKNHMGSNNKIFELSDVQNLLLDGIKNVDREMWTNFIEHAKNEENRLWNLDTTIDELIDEHEPVVVMTSNSSDDGDLLDSD